MAYFSPFLKWFKKDQDCVSIALHRTTDINLLNNYMKLFPEYFDNTFSVDYGDPDLICEKLQTSLYLGDLAIRSENKNVKLGDKINFCHKEDDMADIKGYVIWEKFSKDIIKQEGDKQIGMKVEFKYPIIYLRKSRNVNPHKFYEMMQEKVNTYYNNHMKIYKDRKISGFK